MCLMVYIGSDKPLPLIAWNENNPSFNISDLTKYEKSVAAQFKFPHVYNAGSHQGCGCGFFKEFKEDEELTQAHDNYHQLNAYLQKAQEMGANNQIFSCWDGDQEAKPEHREEINLNRLIEANFEFKEKALYEIL
jgi:hypothetical protein